MRGGGSSPPGTPRTDLAPVEGVDRFGACVHVRVFRFLLVLCAVLAAPVAMAQDATLLDLKRILAAQAREIESLDVAIERQQAVNARLLEQLDSLDTGVASPVTFGDLRQAQFEVATANTRLLSTDHQIRQQTDRIEDLNEIIVRNSGSIRSGGRDTLQMVVNEAALELREEIRGQANASLDRLGRLRALLRENASLREEGLSIIQRAITLNAIDGYNDASRGPLIERINQLVERLTQSALNLSNAASAITETNPSATQRRNLLRLRSDELLLRSNARLTDAAIVEARASVDALARLTSESAVPTRLFEDAVFALDAQADALGERLETTQSSARATTDLASILAEPERVGAGTDALLVRVERLRDLLSMQTHEVEALLKTIAETRAALVREQTQRNRATLFTRNEIRIDAASQARIRDELVEIPTELRTLYEARLAEVRTAVAVATPNRLVVFGVCVLLVIIVTVVLRQKVLKAFISNAATRATEMPLEVLRRNLFWLFPVAVWAIFIELFAISRATATALFPLLAIPAAAALLRDLTSVIVARSSGRQRRIGTLITRAMEVAMVLTAVVVFAYVLLAELPLLPSTASAINRLAFSVFLLAALPMLLFVFFFTAAHSQGTDPNSEQRTGLTVRGVVAAVLSLLPPLALIATGLAGLAGYRDLAALLLEQLGTAILIAATLALALGILSDIKDVIAISMRERYPGQAQFIGENLLQPLLRASQIALIFVTLIVAANIFEWTSETPVIHQALGIWRTVLFTAGGQPYAVGNVIIGILSIAVVFWLGAWFQRVTYSVFLSKVRDVGIRQSLSVFAQYVVIVVGVLLALSAIGFDVTTLTVFAASLGVGIGFGLQNVVNNFISGILLLVERPLRIGDIVTVGGQSGTVSQIGIRSMRMRTFDEFDLVVPNSQLIAETFTNWTRSNSLMRVVLPVGISYSDEPDTAVKIATRVLSRHPYVVRNPAPLVTVDEFGDSSVNLRVCYYIDLRADVSGFVVRGEVLSGIRRAFGEAGISIPFPQRDLHIITPKGEAAALRDQMDRVADRAPGVVQNAGDPSDFASEAIDKTLAEE